MVEKISKIIDAYLVHGIPGSISMITKKLEPISSDNVRIDKRIYDKVESKDGVRILVMRLWPRGVKKSKIDTWMKELGTDVKLIKDWKGGKITRTEFRKRYLEELRSMPEKIELVKEISDQVRRGRTVSLLCSCKDPESCHRSILKDEIVAML